MLSAIKLKNFPQLLGTVQDWTPADGSLVAAYVITDSYVGNTVALSAH